MSLFGDIIGVIAIIIMLVIASASNDKEGLIIGIKKTVKTVTTVFGKIVSRLNRI